MEDELVSDDHDQNLLWKTHYLVFELTMVPSRLCDPHSHQEEGAPGLWEITPCVCLLFWGGWSVLLGSGRPCQRTSWGFLESSARHQFGLRSHGAVGGCVAGAGNQEVWVSGC